MKVHYFDQKKADEDDIFLAMAIQQGYVPKDCKIGGQLVMATINMNRDPCNGCMCDREKCGGRKGE